MSGGGKGGGAPESPNYAALIPAQTDANLRTFDTMLGASRADQITPFGSSTWSSTPQFDQQGFNEALQKWQSSPDLFRNAGEYQAAKPTESAYTRDAWQNVISLSPEQQQLYDANVGSQLQQANLLSGLGSRAGESVAQPLDFSQLQGSFTPSNFQQPNYANNLPDPRQYSQQGADAAYGMATRYLQPEQERQQKQIEARLGEQGFVPGTPAYNDAMNNFRMTNDRALADARDRAILTGHGMGRDFFTGDQTNRGMERQQTLDANQIADRLFNQNVESRTRSLAELLTKRQYPLNELNAFRSGTQIQLPNTQSTFATPNLQGVDIMGAAQQGYANELGKYNADVGSGNALLGVLGSLGGAALGAPWMAPLLGLAGKG